ncbi:MAG: orotidine 5'-phosphate decarboxylase [Actinobacteria bacterium RBG_19FT_COMBO_54_7]|uniref:Orotidine 5'-phosphate decarboxylase n=1 Tax=Candidatus Solincola sediminis TaxID=1797199 RepID=A0A1F2WS42_9ACTN|nr:MAG: orotidine 5'-phosphate decarboxylase [Candidatus Solincola sediminis]OFW61621.1 MAG: orotidine 5'-phosphate decarboxylase [Candidatus Solincola sediminis]OFW65498.1 MAG: orotidine 5'-phosphate decarboxylase [Actinobacteria bacterium RBG_19FT_COMBO_54_7]
MKREHDPLIIACDLDNWEDVHSLAAALEGLVETVKIGLEAYLNLGPQVITEMRERGFRVFGDLKFNDIPNTVSKAARALTRSGVNMMTLHASGGREMLRAAVRASKEEASLLGVSAPIMLGVTVLTSCDEATAREVGWTRPIREQVLSLAGLAIECGLEGVVASAREALLLRQELGEEPIIVTPGIRPAGSAVGDQVRTATPQEALNAGADYLVIGRAVTDADVPRAALESIRIALGASRREGKRKA